MPIRPLMSMVLLNVALLAACQQESEPEQSRFRQSQYLYPYEQRFGYAQAVRIGKTVYISGTMAADREGRLVGEGDMAAQLQAAYANIARTLGSQDLTFENVVRETIYTTDMEALLKVSDLRFNYYARETLPAATWVQVERLVDPGFLVAIEVVAEAP